MAVVNIMFGGYDLSDELKETTNTMNDAVAKEQARAEAAEKAINDELDGLADLLDSI